MKVTADQLPSSTGRLSVELTAVLKRLEPGQKIRLTQRVRVGSKIWQAVATGRFRELNYLATGLATDRARDEEVIVAAVHFVKDNGELSSVTLDEHSQIEILES